MWILISIWLASILFLTRTVLMITGFLKSPFLYHFEKYGDEEEFIQLTASFLGGLGFFALITNILLVKVAGYDMFLLSFSLMLWVLAFLSYKRPEWLGHPYGLILNHPRWLHELSQRTTRLERRRIAYMWMRLPLKLRVVYNSNDRAFLEWADMVILGSLF